MTLTKQEHRGVANTIYLQLGGRQFAAMTGAKNLFALDNVPGGGLQLDFGLCRKANRLIVKVDTWDTYTVEFWKIPRKLTKKMLEAGWKPEPVKVYDGVYEDMLQDIFTDFTGLETSLGTLGGEG